MIFVAGGAGGRTSDTATRCGSAEASTPKVRRLPRVAHVLCFARSRHLLSVFVRSGEAPERNGAVWRGGQQHLPGVSAPVPSGLCQVALPGGRKEETGGATFNNLKCLNPCLFCFYLLFLNVSTCPCDTLIKASQG